MVNEVDTHGSRTYCEEITREKEAIKQITVMNMKVEHESCVLCVSVVDNTRRAISQGIDIERFKKAHQQRAKWICQNLENTTKGGLVTWRMQ